MAFSVSIAAVLFYAVLVGTARAAPTPQEYWTAALPNTPIPSAVEELLQPNGGVLRAQDRDDYHRDLSNNCWGYAETGANEMDEKDIPDTAVYLLEKDLRPGTKLRLDLTRSAPPTPFVPRHQVDAIPFSSAKLAIASAHFKLASDPIMLRAMEKTLRTCEDKPVKGERKECFTSLESMVDFVTAAFGTHDMWVDSTEVVAKGGGAMKQDFVVAAPPVEKLSTASKNMVCHPLPWPFAVFYCHSIQNTKTSVVKLAGADGAVVEAIAVCHTDTSSWNPKHLSFYMLKVQPGETPICHFLPHANLVWAPRSEVREGLVFSG